MSLTKERYLHQLVFTVFLSHILKQQLCQAQEKSIQRGHQTSFIFANFTDHFFHVLDVQEIVITPVQNSRQCLLHCVKNHRCFSTNIAVYSDSNSHLVCKLLPTDKYNSSASFVSSQIFHHYSIYSPCETSPCKHGGTCRAFYNTNDYSCDCVDPDADKNCIPKAKPKWEQLSDSCFGSSGDQFGSFFIPYSGKLLAIKLVHLSGYVSCLTGLSFRSNWGCGDGALNLVITNSTNQMLLPSSEYRQVPGWSYIPGYTSFSPELELNASEAAPILVSSGDELRLWYGEDLLPDAYENDNSGVSCCEVHALMLCA